MNNVFEYFGDEANEKRYESFCRAKAACNLHISSLSRYADPGFLSHSSVPLNLDPFSMWQLIKSKLQRPGVLIVSVPAIPKSSSWLQRLDVDYPQAESEDDEYAVEAESLCFYTVKPAKA